MINMLIYLLVAAFIGWVATEIMHNRQDLLINVVVAVVGAYLASYILIPIFKVGTINVALNLPTLLVMLLGSLTFHGSVTLLNYLTQHAIVGIVHRSR